MDKYSHEGGGENSANEDGNNGERGGSEMGWDQG